MNSKGNVRAIEWIKNINTVMIFIILVTTIASGGYLIRRLRRPIDTIHVSIDSLHFHDKK